MSELAFNLNGEPFEVPGAAVAWRVRRIKRRGAPEVVYGREGTLLVLPIDADMDDLRHEVRGEGRYRLDPVDDRHRTISDAPVGYVCIHASEPTVVPTPLMRPDVPGTDHVLLEAMRMNTELARTIVEKFPLMLESAAALVRAAGDAGMTTRPPRMLPEPREEEEDDDDDDDEDEPEVEDSAPEATGWSALLQTLIPMIGPVISNAFASGKLQIPGGLGALFDCRRARPKASTAGAYMASMPDVEPTPGPHDSAPAQSGASVTSEPPVSPGQANTLRAAGAGGVVPPTPAFGAEEASPLAPRPATTAPAPKPATTEAPDTEPSPELPALDSAALVHFSAIQRALTPRESMLARTLAAELSPAELRTWFSELQRLSVPAAVARIRAVIGSGTDNTELRSRVGPGPATDGLGGRGGP